MSRLLSLTPIAAAVALAAGAAPALAATPAHPKAGYAAGQVIVQKGASSELHKLPRGTTVKEAMSRLQGKPGVTSVRPNYVARASQALPPGFYPNDPFFKRQWNLNSSFGIRMPQAWRIASRRGGAGGKGVVVAVIDTGVAYENYRGFRRSPDIGRVTKGYDFVDHDSHPDDEHGHGTHVAGTIAQATNNRRGAAGVAYNAKIMPVRVLNAQARGDTLTIARGIRWAAAHGADVINLSFEYDPSKTSADIPEIVSAIRYAKRKGAVVVAAAGNQADTSLALPARLPSVLSVAATTARGCLAFYSDSGPGLDVSAPGGGSDAEPAANAFDERQCRPRIAGRLIYQESFVTASRRFGLLADQGTSMAAPHVSALAALLISTKRVPRKPDAIANRIISTARDLGQPGPDDRYGSGLIDAEAALR